MKVKKIITNGWKVLRSHGDIDEIVTASITEAKPKGISRTTISHALKTGQMNEETFEAINNFYKPRADKMAKEENAAKKAQELLTDND